MVTLVGIFSFLQATHSGELFRRAILPLRPICRGGGLPPEAFSFKITKASIYQYNQIGQFKIKPAKHFMKKITYLLAMSLPSLPFAATVGSVLSTHKEHNGPAYPDIYHSSSPLFFLGSGQYILNFTCGSLEERGRLEIFTDLGHIGANLFVMVSVWGSSVLSQTLLSWYRRDHPDSKDTKHESC